MQFGRPVAANYRGLENSYTSKLINPRDRNTPDFMRGCPRLSRGRGCPRRGGRASIHVTRNYLGPKNPIQSTVEYFLARPQSKTVIGDAKSNCGGVLFC